MSTVQRQSALPVRMERFAPKDEVSKNAQLLLRAGFIAKEMAGVYTFLPLGWRVMNNIMGIIREEMESLGAQEIFLTALQDPSIWETTNRWSDDVVDVWFKTQLKSGAPLGLGFTHEEPVTRLFTRMVSSHKDLPFSVFQIQTKFRNETRAKSGIMRCREFLMKDLYSFSRTSEEHEEFYNRAQNAYERIFARVGIGDSTYLTFASGGTFSKYSHEFQTLCDAGEDVIYVDEKRKIAINEEVMSDDVLNDLGIRREDLVQHTAAEVGNIFSLKTKFSDAFQLLYRDEEGEQRPVVMGSYGIGPGRVMGVAAELFGTESAMVWPVSIAPYAVHVLSLGRNDDALACAKACADRGVDVLLDDRNRRAGEQFAEADMIGCPIRVILSEKTARDGVVEVTDRVSDTTQRIPVAEAPARIAEMVQENTQALCR